MPKKKRRNTVCLAFQSLLLTCLSSSNNTLFLFSIFFPFNFSCCSLKSQRNHSPGSAQGRKPWKLEKEVRVEICTTRTISSPVNFPAMNPDVSLSSTQVTKAFVVLTLGIGYFHSCADARYHQVRDSPSTPRRTQRRKLSKVQVILGSFPPLLCYQAVGGDGNARLVGGIKFRDGGTLGAANNRMLGNTHFFFQNSHSLQWEGWGRHRRGSERQAEERHRGIRRGWKVRKGGRR